MSPRLDAVMRECARLGLDLRVDAAPAYDYGGVRRHMGDLSGMPLVTVGRANRLVAFESAPGTPRAWRVDVGDRHAGQVAGALAAQWRTHETGRERHEP